MQLAIGIFEQDSSADNLSEAIEVICIDNFDQVQEAYSRRFGSEKVRYFIEQNLSTKEELEAALASLYAQQQ